VQKLLERSNKVIATARVPADAQQLQQLAASNSNLTVAALDISQPDSIAAFAAEVKKHTPHVDVSAVQLPAHAWSAGQVSLHELPTANA
jgi:NAD(P)-dependent dehydrogenase (short-subunit alcohol dehydrogenase family)